MLKQAFKIQIFVLVMLGQFGFCRSLLSNTFPSKLFSKVGHSFHAKTNEMENEEDNYFMRSESFQDINQSILEDKRGSFEVKLIDSHCHLHFSTIQFKDQRFHVCPMSVDEEDWPKILEFERNNEEFCYKIGLGLHPWYVDNTSSKWIENLEVCLLENTEAIVGEIGLDKTKRGGNWEAQVAAFSQQLDLAARLQRPVSVHCVRAWGPLMEVLSQKPPDQLPPAITLHSYTGSADFAQSLLRIPGVGERIYYGFSSSVNLRTPKNLPKLLGILESLPEDKILLESDAENESGVFEGLNSVAAVILQARPTLLSVEGVVDLCSQNAIHFFCTPQSS
mmetsp:Transcript_38278/g.50445  ORF Transcript_38278/g.50445 Transcript_38278/m.50445 type:complete len:335 (+) Transcript_38278:151-1155(+)